jgi:steroid delta-isomerase
MNPADPTATAQRYLAAYAAKDLTAIEPLLAPTVWLRDWHHRVDGKSAVLDETQANFDAASSLGIELLQLHAGAASVAAELRIVVGGEIELFVVDIFEFDAQGRICALRAYKGIGG